MKICRFCQEAISDQEEICGNCGYNPKTDTLSAGFVKKEKKLSGGKNNRKISPGVKVFVSWGIIITVFSSGLKYQGKIGDIIWETKNFLSGNKMKKNNPASQEANQNKIARLIDVRSYSPASEKSLEKDRRVEGIFYDPQGISYVLINGQLVTEKESLGNLVIKKINSNSVEVTEEGKEKTLTVNN